MHRIEVFNTGPAADPLSVLSPAYILALLMVSETTLWRMRKDGRFPAPLQLSAGRVGWLRRDIERWLASRDTV